jgi:hypothetical protein
MLAHSYEHLLTNLVHFARLLRQLGLKVHTSQLADLAQGLTSIDIAQRQDFYYATRAFLVHHPDERERFDRAFDLFWSGLQPWLAVGRRAGRPTDRNQRQPRLISDQPALDHALRQVPELEEHAADTTADTEVSATYSPWEILRHKDFATFSDEEMALVRRVLEEIVWHVNQRLTRRLRRSAMRTAQLSVPDTIRRSLKHRGELVELAWSRPQLKPRPLVVICDISGSMERYARVLLQLMYTLARGDQPVEVFVFGTRLTRITPGLRHKAIDVALRQVADSVVDWSGGTRIGESLRTFNFRWGRRVLRRGAVAIIISDGWDRGDIGLLRQEMGRLRRSAHHLMWLNPLLGTPGYQPLVQGIQAALPYVDHFMPLHNLVTLGQLAARLGSLR